MNPDTGEFEKLQQLETTESLYQMYGHNNREEMPVFRTGEEVLLRGALWKVVLIHKRILKFRYLRMATSDEMAEQ